MYVRLQSSILMLFNGLIILNFRYSLYIWYTQSSFSLLFIEYAQSTPLVFFSSPEHKVLIVSFSGRPMSGVRRASSVVRRPSCVVHNFFKHLFLLNDWANFDETWQGCSMGEALPKLFKRLNSSHNSGYHGNEKEKIAKSLKIFFSETRSIELWYFVWTSYQDCPYDVPGVKTGPALGVTSSKHRNKEGKV